MVINLPDQHNAIALSALLSTSIPCEGSSQGSSNSRNRRRLMQLRQQQPLRGTLRLY
jgi:hypothetical protein